MQCEVRTAAEETDELQHDGSSTSSIDVEELSIATLLASGFLYSDKL